MAESTQHTEKNRRKWPWIVLGSILAMIGLVRLALMSGPVHHWVRNKIVSTANNQLKVHLSIGNLSGDLWNSATLTDVSLADDSTVASIDTVHLKYDPLSYFSNAFQIHEVRLVHPFIRLRQQPDSNWNVQHWLATDTAAANTGSTFAFNISNLLICRGRLDVHTIQVPQDSSFMVDDLNLASSLGYYGDSYNVGVDDFSFKVKQTQLDAPLTFQAAADASEKSITLQKLAIATGHSLLHASGRVNLADSSADFNAEAKPLGWNDLAAYADSLPVRKDLNLSLNFKGDMNRFEATLSGGGEGIDQLSLHGTMERDSAFVLTGFQASADRLDLASFMGDTTMPQLQNVELEADGRLPLDDYQQANMEGHLSASNIRQGSYSVDAMNGNFQLTGNEVRLRLEPVKGGQRIIAQAHISRLWDDTPSLYVSVSGSHINPSTWLPDQQYGGDLTFEGHVSGRGWMPGQDFWQYELIAHNSTLMDQPFDTLSVSGRFNQHKLTNRSDLAIAQSKLHLKADVNQLQSVPVFSYDLAIRDFDLSDFNGLAEYPSMIDGQVTGNGSGDSMENLQMQVQAQIDSSNFNGEAIQQFAMDARLADSVLTIDKTTLKSGIADANMEGHLQIEDLYDSRSRLNLHINVKDISSFAPAANADVLYATGTIDGELKPTAKDSLVFDGRVDLKELNFNNEYTADRIDGGIRLNVDQQPQYLFDVKIAQPTVSSVVFQDIDLRTEGEFTDKGTHGSFNLKLTSAREGEIRQEGSYQLREDSTNVELTKFNLKSTLRTLSLQQPFHATLVRSTLKTDTLRLRSPDEAAFVALAIPYADSLHQDVHLDARNLNLQAIQESILKQSYLQGMLRADLDLDRTDTSMVASGNIRLSDLQYKDTKLDTLQLQADIENERLKGEMQLWQDSLLIADGKADIPFKAKRSGRLDNGFFQQPVSGELTLHKFELDRFQSLLEEFGYKNTKGTIQFDGKLSGEADEPKLNAKLSLRNAELSGVPVDSLIATANYQHSASELKLNASLTSLKQKVLDANAQMPLTVDLEDLDVGFPGPQDSVMIDLQTDNFNLKVLNDFLDKNTARDLEGRINGDVKISGPRSDLYTSGQMTLKKGAVRVVPAGIRLDHMNSILQFQPDKIVLQNFHMESGKGGLDAKGELAMKQLVPGDIDISVNAKNFKAANTDEYNALVNMNMKLGGSVTQPKVTGKLEMINGFIELDNFGEKSVEEVSLDTMLSPKPNISLYDSLSLDLDVEFNRRFFVRNQRYLEMEIELDGQVDILKDPGKDLQLFGTLNTSNGYAKPLGKRFELEEGSLAFSGPPDNPQINIRTLYEPPQANQEVKIWYIIEGTVENPQFKYESEPPMDLAGIISYTLFGQPFYKLNPAEQSVASSSSNSTVADFAVEVLMDHLESLATKRLGIDVVRIENTRVGGENGTSVTTGWYINPKVFFAIQNVITGATPTTGFYLEYFLQDNLKLILSQGYDNRQGIDLQWEHDY